MALRLCLFLAQLQEESKKKVVISICLLTGSSVDIVRNHQNLNPRLRKRILKDGIFIF